MRRRSHITPPAQRPVCRTPWNPGAERDPNGPYRVDESGSIVSRRGAVLYEAESIAGLSAEAKTRLARLHTLDKDLPWEGVTAEGIVGAWDILEREGLMPVTL